MITTPTRQAGLPTVTEFMAHQREHPYSDAGGGLWSVQTIDGPCYITVKADGSDIWYRNPPQAHSWCSVLTMQQRYRCGVWTPVAADGLSVQAAPLPPNLEQQVQEIEARAEAATPGPWATHGDGRCPCGEVYGPDGNVGIHHAVTNDYFDIIPSMEQQVANSAFIAHAPEDIGYLLAALRAAMGQGQRNVIAQLRDEANEMYGDIGADAATREEAFADLKTVNYFIDWLEERQVLGPAAQNTALTEAVADLVELYRINLPHGPCGSNDLWDSVHYRIVAAVDPTALPDCDYTRMLLAMPRPSFDADSGPILPPGEPDAP